MDDIKDVVPGLLERIQKDFKEQFSKDRTVIQTYGKMKSKMATYKEANEFSIRVGEMLANSFSRYLTPDSLPEGRMYYNIATRILEPTLHTNYSLITDVCKAAQEAANKKSGVGLKAVTPDFNKDRLKGLVDKVSNAENYEEVEWVLQEPVVNFSQSVVDDSIKTNAEFHYQSGLTPKIRRTAESGCCDWCRNLEGTYEYPYVSRDVYRKHENCRCTVEYIEDGKYIRDVHRKQWQSEVPAAERQRQIQQQAQATQAEARRQAEEIAVRELMKANPTWTKRGATIYYRTKMAPRS